MTSMSGATRFKDILPAEQAYALKVAKVLVLPEDVAGEGAVAAGLRNRNNRKNHIACQLRSSTLTPKEADLNGVFGEIALAMFVGGEWNRDTKGRDAGYDLLSHGSMIDVKSTSKPGYRLVPNPKESKASPQPLLSDIYVLTFIDAPERKVGLVGWVTSGDITENAHAARELRGGPRAILASETRKMNTLLPYLRSLKRKAA